MTISGIIFVISITVTMVFYWRYAIPSLGLSSTLLGLMLLLHGPAYWYYMHQWSHGEGAIYELYRGTGTQQAIDPSLASASLRFYDRIVGAVQNNGLINAVQDNNLFNLDVSLAIIFIMLCVGIWVADQLFRKTPFDHKQALHRWAGEPVSQIAFAGSIRVRIVIGAAILFLLYYLVSDNQLFKIYTYFASREGEFGKILMRREMGGSRSYAFNFLLGTLMTFLAFYVWVWGREGTNQGVCWLAVGMVMLVISAKLATLSKAPGAIFILQLLVLEMARRSLQITWKSGAVFLGVALLLFSIMTFIANANLSSVLESLIFLFYRVFMIPNESLLEYFLVFPDQIEHTLGQDIRALAILLGLEPLQSNYWRVAEALRGVGGSTTTAMFLADAWAAFAWLGVVVIPFALGFLVRWIDIELIVNRRRSYASIAGLGLGHYGIWIAMSTAFQTALLTGGLLLILPLVFVLKWLEGEKSLSTMKQG